MSVFISYRRVGGKRIAEKIYSVLSKDYDVFLDTESMKKGYFDEQITEKIENCSDFIIIITKHIFDRCSEKDDWILRELEIAIDKHKNIIPIFFGVKSFPSNIPESIMKKDEKFDKLEGILWSNKQSVFAKLISFLDSNRRYILSVVNKKNKIGLDEKTIDDLKGLYRRFKNNGRLPVDVQINIKNPKKLSKLIVRQDIKDTKTAKFYSEQTLLKREKSYKHSIEVGIEYLLQDELIENEAEKLRDYYHSKYGVSNCYFVNEKGTQFYYGTLFLWIDIIEEILKELLYDRWYSYNNSKDLDGIDCFLEQNGKVLWSFNSFISKNPDAESYKKFVDGVFLTLGHADFFDLPLYDLAFHVYPDFYYNIGLLKTKDSSQAFDSVAKNKGYFNLMNYYYALK